VAMNSKKSEERL